MEKKLNSERVFTIWTSAEGIEFFNKAVREQYDKLYNYKNYKNT